MKIVKKEELRRLTWNYFISQKVMEIIKFLLIIALIIFAPYFIGISINILAFNNETGPLLLIWSYGLIVLLFFTSGILLVAIIIYYIILWLIEWINSNWEYAKINAKKELK